MSKRKKLLAKLRGPGRGNVRFEEIASLAEYLGFTLTARGADYIFRHDGLVKQVFIGRPHGGKDVVRGHDIDRLVEAIDALIDQGLIEDPANDSDDSVD